MYVLIPLGNMTVRTLALGASSLKEQHLERSEQHYYREYVRIRPTSN